LENQCCILVPLKALPFEIPKDSDASFVFQEDLDQLFYPNFHSHPELQITSIIKGRGSAFIGDWTGEFRPGMAFIIGSSVPHVFKTEESPEHPDEKSHSLAVFLQKSSLGDGFFDLPEIRHSNEIFKGHKAWRVHESLESEIANRLRSIQKSNGAHRLSELILLIDSLADLQGLELLTSGDGSWAQSAHMSRRLAVVLDHIGSNYQKDVTQAQLAEKANLTPSAFSRFFVKCTGRSFKTYLNDLRLTHACNLLMRTDQDIMSICIASGFNNVSNFNRRFKNRKGMTPREFRARYRGL
jgi:AraC-like DNA-binding protein